MRWHLCYRKPQAYVRMRVIKNPIPFRLSFVSSRREMVADYMGNVCTGAFGATLRSLLPG
jgi:hypothetical protein